jgi:ribulose-5-phosphate 4-epimerase/fuculose-1-phosphate aldolase
MRNEGYVKYTAEHKNSPAIDVPNWDSLNNARTHLYKLGLVGETLDGLGYGNLSIRYQENQFLISGNATGSLPVLDPSGYCHVNSFDLEQNHVVTSGPIQASSESMSHGVVYQSCSEVNCVIHIHSRNIFDRMIQDNYPATPMDAEFGTPEIALAIGKCIEVSGKNEGQIVLSGHDEGIICYGPSVERALHLILELYNKYSL